MEIVVTKIPEPKQKDEMFGFEFEGNQVRFLGKTLEPSIASGVFLLYDAVKKGQERRKEIKKRKANLQVEYENCMERIGTQREQITGILKKYEMLEIQNKALIEYVKKLKKG